MSGYATPDLSLTDAERTAFNAAVTTASLDATASWNNVIALSASGTIPGGFVTQVTVTSVAQMKQLVGITNAQVQSAGASSYHLPAPGVAATKPGLASLAPRDLAKAISLPQHRSLQRAAGTFVFGDSGTVATDAPLIDLLHFPVTVNVVGAQSLTLADGAVLNLDGSPWLLILGSLYVGTGAQIASTVDTVVNTQVAYSAN